MNKISDMMRIYCIKLLRLAVRLAFILPIKENRLLFSSYLGESYSCNPKYLSEYIKEKYLEKYEIVWAFKDTNRFSEIKGIKSIQYKSLKWMYYTVTSKVIVGNNGAVWIPRRKKQLIIDTWHGGGCYKRVAAADNNTSKLENYRTSISGQEVNLYLSSCNYFSEYVVRKSFLYNGNILPSGMPRNDILFKDGDVRPSKLLREEIARKYSFDPQKFIVLFAPTWRKGKQRTEQLDISEVQKSIKIRFGKEAVVLGRGHHTEDGILEQDVIDVTSYHDMQELLVIADMLITDYSSSIWDFSFTGKPCFLFATDLDTYSKNPGFNCEIYSWGFPVCKNNRELSLEIESFDFEEHKKRMDKHHIALHSYEDGHACEKVCEYIRSFCENN
ncbi:MAG: CDP-glycerol glycerophosphotransferase family protein [Lachnospiraceae bacterium]